MFNLSEQVRRLPATPKSRLTKREILILGHITSLKIQELGGTGSLTKELKRILEKINVQLRQRS